MITIEIHLPLFIEKIIWKVQRHFGDVVSQGELQYQLKGMQADRVRDRSYYKYAYDYAFKGHSLERVAEDYKVTRERVRQCIMKIYRDSK